jgi:general secretion pathway protein L
MERVDLLRLMLPPARAVDTAPVRCAWRTAQGWQGATLENLAALAALSTPSRPRRVEVCPHPGDVSMTTLELPPLPAARLRVAVLGAIELLALAAPADLAVGIGARDATGRVPVAWMSAEALSACLRALRQHGLAVQAVLAPPAFLPAPDQGLAALRVDGWAIVRSGAGSGLVHPLAAAQADPVQLEARLRPLLPGALPLHWLAESEASSFAGSGWAWTLPMAASGGEGTDRRWLRPAIGWSVATAAVCLLGLQLQAARVAAEGQALTRQMAAQVKAAFPELPVVLNPLQQARQLRDARRAGTTMGSIESADFAALVRASTAVLAQAEGQVQGLDFRDGQLRVRWRAGVVLGADELKALQTSAQQRGLQLLSEEGGLRVALAETKQGGEGSVAPAAASKTAAQNGAAP